MMDGISTMDTGSNGCMLQMNVGVDRRGQGPGVGLPGRIRAVERPADHGRDQERHEPVPRLALRRRAQLRLERQQQDEHAQRRSRRPSSKEKDWGYSIGGPVGKPGGNNKLFFFYAQEFRPRTGGNDHAALPRADRARARRRLLADARQQRRALPYIKDPLLTGACNATEPGGLLPGRRRARQDPGEPALPAGAEHPQHVAAAARRARRSARNLQFIRPAEDTLAYQPAVRFDYQALPSLRVSYKYQGQISRQQVNQGTHPRMERHRDAVHRASARTPGPVNYNLSSTMFLEGTFGRAWNKQGS